MKTKIIDSIILISTIILFAFAHVSPIIGFIMMSLGDGLFQVLGSVFLTISIAGLAYIHHWNGSFRTPADKGKSR
jgi:hypothetical protein